MIDLRFLKTVPANLMSALSPYIRPLAPCLATPTTGYATPAQLASSRQPAVNPASRAIVPFTAVSRRVAPPQDIIWPAAQLAIRVPRGMPFSPAGALQLVSTLLGLRHVLALEIHSGEGRISYRLVVPWSAGQAARAAVLAVAPQAEIEVSQPSVRQGRPMALPLGSRSGLPWAPLPGLCNARGPDPLNPLLQSLAGLQRREEAVLQILIRPPSLDWSAAIHQAITVKSIPWGDLVDWRRWPLAPLNYALAEPQPRFDAQIDRLCQEKLNERLVEAVITLGIWSSAERARLIARTCAMALNSFATPLTSLGLLPQGCASPSELLASLLAHHFSVARGSARSRRLLVLTPGELAALWHLPSEATTAETVTWALPGSLMAPPQAVARSQSQYVILGAATRPEGRQPVLLPEADRRGPLLIIGKTGMGKTCLMENLVHQDVIGGRGVTLLDVHGDMTLRLLSRIPEPRIAQTVVIDTSAAASAIALNPLALASRLDPSVLVGELIGVFRQYFGELWSVGRMEDTMRAVLWVLTARPGLSLGDMARLFHDPVFRQQLATAVANPVVKEYWLQEFAQLSAAQQQERSGVLLNKVRAFLTNDKLRRMLTAPSCLDLRQHMDRGGLLFVRPVGLPEPDSTLLVGLVAALLFTAARSRADAPVEQRRLCYLYLDEAQTISSSALPSILSQGRKFGLVCAGLALQYLEALDAATRQALLGNASTFVVFRCGPGDARLLQPVLAPLGATDLENLDRYRAVCKMQRGGETLPPFGLAAPDPLAPGPAERAAAVLAASRQSYGVLEVETPHEQQDDHQRANGLDDAWQPA